MIKTKGYSNKEEVKTLRDCVELYALSICEDMEKERELKEHYRDAKSSIPLLEHWQLSVVRKVEWILNYVNRVFSGRKFFDDFRVVFGVHFLKFIERTSKPATLSCCIGRSKLIIIHFKFTSL